MQIIEQSVIFLKVSFLLFYNISAALEKNDCYNKRITLMTVVNDGLWKQQFFVEFEPATGSFHAESFVNIS